MHRSSTSVTPLDTSVVDALMNPAAYGHPVSCVELTATHISWLLLAGDYVYKLKKPITLDFLDFQRLEQRKFYCDEEIRLNQPFAPEIYLDVVAITREKGQTCVGGNGTPIEYAVRMRRFDQAMRLDAQLEQGDLSIADMLELARNIAARHSAAKVIGEDQRDRVIAVTRKFIRDNFIALDGILGDADLERLRNWTEQELERVETVLWQRFDDGFVRDCHGDLHLANLVRLPSGITTFDCIEFSSDLRHIDVTCDVAFLTMDLVERQRRDLAAHFLNRYLECTGDYDGMRMLSLYFVYRCLVRAKVAAIRSQERSLAAERQADLAEMHDYCDMARRQITQLAPILVIMCGLSGSGKTRISDEVMAALPAIRIRSDIERKRMAGLKEKERSESGIGEGIYTERASQDVYDYLLNTARTILSAGHSVILDAANLKTANRMAAFRTATSCDCAAVLLEVTAPFEVLRDRIRQRSNRADDASEAGVEILEHQIATAEPLTHDELEYAIRFDNTAQIDATSIAKQVREIAKRQTSTNS